MRLLASKKAGHRGIYYFIPLFIFLTVQEVALRFVFPVPDVLNFNRITYSLTRITPDMQTARYLSNASFTKTSTPDSAEFIHILNLYGFRDTNWTLEKDEDRERIMFIGDSFVEGVMASQGKTIPDQFEQVAQREGKNIEALNMGVAASNTSVP